MSLMDQLNVLGRKSKPSGLPEGLIAPKPKNKRKAKRHVQIPTTPTAKIRARNAKATEPIIRKEIMSSFDRLVLCLIAQGEFDKAVAVPASGEAGKQALAYQAAYRRLDQAKCGCEYKMLPPENPGRPGVPTKETVQSVWVNDKEIRFTGCRTCLGLFAHTVVEGAEVQSRMLEEVRRTGK